MLGTCGSAAELILLLRAAGEGHGVCSVGVRPAVLLNKCPVGLTIGSTRVISEMGIGTVRKRLD